MWNVHVILWSYFVLRYHLLVINNTVVIQESGNEIYLSNVNIERFTPALEFTLIYMVFLFSFSGEFRLSHVSGTRWADITVVRTGRLQFLLSLRGRSGKIQTCYDLHRDRINSRLNAANLIVVAAAADSIDLVDFLTLNH